MAPLVGKILDGGKYTVEQELGRGGFGITYRAINHALNQIVVIKTLDEAWRYDPKFAEFQRQFQDEARRLARCSHPNIVRVSDFFVEDGLPCIVMDYIPGQTLGEIVFPSNPLPEAVALHYIQQVADAVRVIHQSGLLHRDIKPQNLILRQGTEQVVLIDFGIAREFTPGSVQTHTHMVSDGYAPIEQYLPQATRTSATDVYALAATLYTLLTAQVPIAAVLRDRVPLASPRDIRPDLSAAVSEAVMRGMAIELQHRPSTVDAWLGLFPNAYGSAPTVAAAGHSVSRMATVPVAPGYRRPAKTVAVPVAAPSVKPSPSSNSWIPGLALIGAIASFALGFVIFRALTVSTPQPDEAPSPSIQAPSLDESPRQREPEPVQSATPTEEPEQTTPEITEPSPPEASPTSEPAEAVSPTPAESVAPSPVPSEPAAPPTNTQPSPDVREPEPPSLPTEPPTETQPSQEGQANSEQRQNGQEAQPQQEFNPNEGQRKDITGEGQ